ncbi:MAG: LytTR family DNA-binding domain-containing protein [Pseudomonadota bacterium]
MNNFINTGTVLGRWSLAVSIPAIAAALIVFFAIIAPEASRGLDFVERLVFWALHVLTGLAGLLLASLMLQPSFMSRLSPIVAIMLSGLLGALIMLPVFFGIEFVLPAALQAEELRSLDRFADRGIWQALAVEALNVVPTVLVTWVVINLPLLLVRPDVNIGDKIEDVPEPVAVAREQNALTDAFLQRLPVAVGRDIYAISSDLHYLHVFTADGKCMIHGSMRGAIAGLGDAGLQVHRSHWVARHAVQKLVRNNGQTFCVLHNGLRIPVSRRNRKAVQDWFGSEARVVAIDEASRERERGLR